MLNNLGAFSEAVLSSRMDAAWSYDRNTGRYRDERGKFLSQASVQKLVDGRIDKLEASLKRFTRMLNDGSITLDQWQGSVREAIKAAHIQAAIIGHGGKAGMGSAEYGRVGQKHCEDCLRYAARGTVPIGSVPLPGQRCACGARCRCSVRYFRQQPQAVPV